jgi:hypothetical protein
MNAVGSNFNGSAFVGLTLLICFYLLPLMVATGRKAPNVGSVAVINILPGWTFFGWIVALAMAARTVPPAQQTDVLLQEARPQQFYTPPAPPGASVVSSAPGWYADPIGLARLRYHDGNAWTEHIG